MSSALQLNESDAAVGSSKSWLRKSFALLHPCGIGMNRPSVQTDVSPVVKPADVSVLDLHND